MEIEVQLANNFTYKVSGSRFPLQVIVKTDEPILIDKNININRLELINVDEELLSYGINRTILSKSSDFIELSNDNPIKLEVDLFEGGVVDEEEELFPGKYKVKSEVTVFVNDNGNIYAHVVKLNKEVIVTVSA